jgi:hypothetical protein
MDWLRAYGFHALSDLNIGYAGGSGRSLAAPSEWSQELRTIARPPYQPACDPERTQQQQRNAGAEMRLSLAVLALPIEKQFRRYSRGE